MKRLTFLLTFSCIVFTYSCAQSDTSAPKINKKAPKIEFVETTHDFGIIEYKGNGTNYFIFKNTGKEPLVLSNVKSSCGCTVPKWPKTPILKNTTDTIQVTYNTARVGSFTKSVTVTSNDPLQPNVVLIIKGSVNPAPPVEETEETK